MKYRWDSCNKWLYLGKDERWCIQFDEWLRWFPLYKLQFRTWTLFRIQWDNGAFWAFDLDNALNINDNKYCKLNGSLEIRIFGIGIRKEYKRNVVFYKIKKDVVNNESNR